LAGSRQSGNVAAASRPGRPIDTHSDDPVRTAAPGVIDTPVQGFLPNARAFAAKVNDDWVMNLAGMLAYNLLTAILPLIVGLAAIAGLPLGNFSIRRQVIRTLSDALPPAFRDAVNLPTIVEAFSQSSGLLGLLGLLGLIIGGSNLFVTMEDALNVVFRARARSFVRQRLVAIGMVFLFAVLVVVFTVAGSLPGYGRRLAEAINLPELAGLLGLTSPLLATLSAFLLLLAIYAIVPNRPVSFHQAWRGAIVGALSLTLVTLLFPLYARLADPTQHYGAFVGFALLSVFWLWLFSVVLLLGAEINSYFGLGQRAGESDGPAVPWRPQGRDRPIPLTDRAAK